MMGWSSGSSCLGQFVVHSFGSLGFFHVLSGMCSFIIFCIVKMFFDVV